MKQRVLGYTALAAAMTLAIGIAAAAGGENTWVTAKGHNVHLDGGNAMFLSDDATEVRMDDLADGETRTFGAGEKQITASRRGDVVSFSRAGGADSSVVDLECTIGKDSCKVVTFADDPERVMLVVERKRNCENGEGDCADVNVMVQALGGADGSRTTLRRIAGEPGEGMHVIRIHKTVDCDPGGDCEDVTATLGDGDDAMANVIIETLGDGTSVHGKHGEMIFIQAGDKVTLRCPEGDTTMNVEPKEADDVFLCPKHSTPLAKVEGQPRVMRHRVMRDSD